MCNVCFPVTAWCLHKHAEATRSVQPSFIRPPTSVHAMLLQTHYVPPKLPFNKLAPKKTQSKKPTISNHLSVSDVWLCDMSPLALRRGGTGCAGGRHGVIGYGAGGGAATREGRRRRRRRRASCSRQRAGRRGEAVQIDSITTTLNAPGTKRLTLKCDEQRSNVAFNSNLRHYTGVEEREFTIEVGRCRLTL